MFKSSVHPPPLDTLLDPQETTLRSPAPPPPELEYQPIETCGWNEPRRDLADVNFRHSGWHSTRRRVFAALLETGASESRLTRFEVCGKHAWVLRSLDNPDRYQIASDTCHDRFCLPCANTRSRRISRNVLSRLSHAHARLITLTLRADSESLVEILARITASFARLRTYAAWKRSVTGGVAFLEVKRSSTTSRWNVHYHLITQGRYLPKEHLAAAWKRITTDSHIVDIRYVRDLDTVSRYVAKYASKPLDPSVTRDPDHLREAVSALKGKRLCSTFGSWTDLNLTAPPPDEDWEPVAPLYQILAHANRGDPTAITILAALRSMNPCNTRGPPRPTSTRSVVPGTRPYDCVDFPFAPTVPNH